MKSNLINDPYGYEDEIRKVFPAALISPCNNFDDLYCGWDICPYPGVIIRFGLQIGYPEYISIECAITSIYNKETKYKRLYNGQIPSNDQGPDVELIGHIIRNYHVIG